MEVIVRVVDSTFESPRDELLDLNAWLVDHDAFRGRTRLVESPPSPGTMGGVLDAVALTISSGVTAREVARVVVAWMQARRANLSLELDGRNVNIEGLQGLKADDVARLVEETTRALESDPDQAG